MAAENPGLISAENLQTIVAVTFVLALLSVAFNFYNFTRIQQTHGLVAAANNTNVSQINASQQEASNRLGSLETKMDAAEKKIAALEAAEAAPQPD